MIIQMAWRNIWRNKIRSLIIALSVTIGLFAGLGVLALHKGMLKSRVRTVIDAEVSHLQIHHPEFKKDYDPKYILDSGNQRINQLRSNILVKAVTIRSVTQAMLTTTSGSAGVQVNGIMPETENQVSQLNKKIREGTGFIGQKKNEIIISSKLARKMKLKMGSKVVLTFTDTAANIVAAAFRIAGIFQTENTPLDEKNVYVTMHDLNDLLGINNSFHEAAILLKNDNNLERAQEEIKKEFPAELVETWKEISPETELLVNTLDFYMYIIIGIIMLALAFGIINTMLMAVLERTKEVGMMIALGMDRFKLFTLVLLETIFLTITGTPVGILLAWLATGYFNKQGIDTTSFAGETMSSFGFSSIIYPEFPFNELPVVLTIVIITALVSSIFPAIKLGKMQPVEVLRK